MIFVDPREGSDKLVAPLRAAGIEVDDKVELPGGDLYFVGRGDHGAPVQVGIEYKTIADVVTSIRTERLQGHQLLEMRGIDASVHTKPLYDIAYLLIEGELTYDAKGMLMRRSGRQSFKPLYMSVDELFKRLNDMHLCAGLHYFHARNRRDSVRWISALYHTHIDKDRDQHKGHLAVYEAPTLIKPTKFRRSIRTFPHVGDRVVRAAETAFGTIKRAVNASADEWAALATIDEKTGKSRRFGTSHAHGIIEHVN